MTLAIAHVANAANVGPNQTLSRKALVTVVAALQHFERSSSPNQTLSRKALVTLAQLE